MAIAIIGGLPERFAPFAQLHREAARRAGHDPDTIPISINSHGFVAETSQAAAEAAWPPFQHQMTKIGRERGWPPVQRQDFDAGRTRRGALFVGSPAEVTEKILFQHEIFNHDRFLLQLSVGTLPHREMLRAIELYGTEVAPAVRAALTPAAV
jgi:alkanesulfonate monooxygenase SsuD/methylene tetrahydromethanopterin reductase-like flavin-dependent oxidoreductase (luciferase family)